MPYPLPLTRTEAYLAYKAGVIQQSDLNPSLAVPRNGIDAWLAYWTGLAADYPKREDGTPHILQEEEAYIAYLCGVINEYPEKCLRRVGAYLRYIISARWGRPDHPLNREELYLSLIKTQFITSGDPSSDITIDGTAKASFVDIKMYGDTHQQTYTGKNLLQPKNYEQGGITTTYNSTTGEIHVHGTPTTYWATVSDQITLNISAGSYMLSLDKACPTIVGLGLTVGGTRTAYPIVKGDTSKAVSVTATPSKADIYLSGMTAGTEIDFKFKIQFEAGSQATSFEPYVGGLPSPNPDYPQSIQTVTGLQTVEVQGKNLNRFPYESGSSRTHRGVTFTANPDGSVTIKGTHDGSGTAIYYFRDFWTYNETKGVIVDANTTITASITGGDGYAIRFIAEGYHSDGTYDQFNTNSTQTITTTAKATFNGRITVYAGFSSTDGVTVYPMIEAGSTATQFVPYSKHAYPINLGNNLFNKDSYGLLTGYLNGTSGKIEASAGAASRAIYIPCEPNTTYTASKVNSGSNPRFCVFDTEELPADGVSALGYVGTPQGLNADTILTYTTKSTAKYLCVFVKAASTEATLDSILATLQIEVGSQATTYAPYKTPIELCKLGTYQDYIWKDGGDWKVHKATGKFLFENMSFYASRIGSASHWRMQSTDLTNIIVRTGSTAITLAKTNVYVARSQSATSSLTMGFDVNASGAVQIYDPDYDTNSAESFIADMTSKGAYIVYPLATPTDTTITDQALIAQLEALVKGGSEEGTTYIKLSTPEPNLPGLLYVEAAKYV